MSGAAATDTGRWPLKGAFLLNWLFSNPSGRHLSHCRLLHDISPQMRHQFKSWHCRVPECRYPESVMKNPIEVQLYPFLYAWRLGSDGFASAVHLAEACMHKLQHRRHRCCHLAGFISQRYRHPNSGCNHTSRVTQGNLISASVGTEPLVPHRPVCRTHYW